jgi:UDP-glucuronate 4-epimerase
MKQVLLTGAAGFIGYHTTLKLLQRGVAVCGVDNINDYYDVRLKNHRLETLLSLKSFEFRHVDIENKEALERVFAEHSFDVVFNLAGRAGVRTSMASPHAYMMTNTMGHLNLLDLVVKYKVPKIVLASTSSLYAGQPTPFVETLPVNTPISPYAASKKAAELLSYTYHHLYGLDVSVTRYFTVYGPSGRPDMSVFRFIKWIDQGIPIQLFGDGNQSRDFTYVEDIANGTIAAARPLGYEVINLGGGRTATTLNELIDEIEKLLGKSAKVQYQDAHSADVATTLADVSKAKSLLGWEPKFSLKAGLSETVNWYLKNVNWIACNEIPELKGD